MKKLLSLMVVCAAAFAGGGLLNEHNLTTMVNYLYHKQQIGRVISLGSIADSPPAELPETLPTAPGAISQAVPISAQTTITPATLSPQQAAAAQPAQASTQVASTQPVVPPPPMDQNPAYTPTPIPSSPPPPLSIHWPNENPTTYRVTPVDPAANAAAPQVAGTTPATAPPTLPGSPNQSPAPNPPGTPVAMAPEMVQNFQNALPVQQQPSPRDNAVGRAGFPAATPAVAAPTPPAAPVWEEVMQKMKESGVQNVEMSTTPGLRLKLRCELVLPELPKPVMIEADGETPVAAGQLALKRIMLFKISRRSRMSKQAEAEPQIASGQQDSDETVTQLNTPQEVAPSPDAGLPPPPPADVPQ